MHNISVVIPVYRSQSTLDLLIRRLGIVLPQVADQFEVILINDDSPDNSWAVIQQLAKEYTWVRGVSLMRNYGQENATLCGIRQARYEIIVTMDDDLQKQPEEMKKLIDKLDEGYDVVYGVAHRRGQSQWKSLFAALVKHAIASMVGLQAIRDISSYRAFHAHLCEVFANYNNSDVMIDALFSWGTNRFSSVMVEEATRKIGTSNYNFWSLVKVALLVLTSYTTIPLRFASVLGIFSTLVGFCIFLYVLIIYFTADSIPGFPFLASTIALFSGIQLFSLGIIGEYLARVFARSGGRPAYIIHHTTGNK